MRSYKACSDSDALQALAPTEGAGSAARSVESVQKSTAFHVKVATKRLFIC